MKTSITVEKMANDDSLIKIQGDDWELNIHMKNDEMPLLKSLRSADWNKRASIKAGTSADASVFWAFDTKEQLVCILVGHDDETWDFAVTIPIAEFTEKWYTYQDDKKST